ncbi:MAG: hypothetical protein ACRC6M_14945 [Microcystaceae cyanobacterium]
MLTATATCYLHRLVIQSKALDYDGIPEETIEIDYPTNEPLTLQQERALMGDKRWSHIIVAHNLIDLFNPNYEF